MRARTTKEADGGWEENSLKNRRREEVSVPLPSRGMSQPPPPTAYYHLFVLFKLPIH